MDEQAAAFEQAIRDDPSDVGKHLVYADWLTDRGDPRGELVHIQIQLEGELSPERRGELSAREAKLLEEHGRHWLGPLAESLLGQEEESHYSFRRHAFERGFLSSIEASELDPGLVLGLRAASPEHLRWLRRLRLLDTEYIEDPVTIEGTELGEDDSLAALLPTDRLGSVRELQLGGLEEGNCHTNGEGIERVVRALPGLEVLTLMAHRVDSRAIFTADLPNLRELTVNHLTSYPLALLAANPAMSKLDKLHCHPHGLEWDDDPYIDLDDLRALAQSEHLIGLTSLTLRLSVFGDAGIHELVRSPMFQRLRTVDFRYGAVTDEGARLFVEFGAHLEHLDLSGNCLSPQGVQMLKDSPLSVTVSSEQYTLGEEREWLWYGDPE
ncbi:MAG: TIGR02996 domain-containing protein [Myxococcales bacterium]|nr:TIGR02996 domain-containing protein [Myxococcales bacterium]